MASAKAQTVTGKDMCNLIAGVLDIAASEMSGSISLALLVPDPEARKTVKQAFCIYEGVDDTDDDEISLWRFAEFLADTVRKEYP